MQIRDDDLAIFIQREIPLLRVWGYDSERGCCQCNKKENCEAPAKHPFDRNGVASARVWKSTESLSDPFYNIGVACGKGFVVLDIDPRNGGDVMMKELVAKHGGLPETWLVGTGGGGLHYYFAIDGEQKSGNKLKKQGVELKGVGSYVLAPSSLHASGREYEWIDRPEDVELAPCPQWIIDETTTPIAERKHAVEGYESNSIYYSVEEIFDALKHIVPKSRDEWLSVGMALHGLSDEFFDAWDDWASHHPGYRSSEASAKVWNSFKRKVGGVSVGTLIKLAEREGWHYAEVDDNFKNMVSSALDNSRKKDTETGIEVDESLGDDGSQLACVPADALRFEAFPGVFSELVENILGSAIVSHKNFAIASALSILAGAFQGRFVTPIRNGSLVQYSCLIAGASGGKAAYVDAARDYVRAVQPERILGATPASAQGFSSALQECNARLLAYDEGLKWIGYVGKNPDLQSVLSQFLTLWSLGGNGILDGIRTKAQANSTPSIKNPAVSFLFAGTYEVFFEMLRRSDSLLSDGFLSRCDFVFGQNQHLTSLDAKCLVLDQSIIERLKYGANRGDTPTKKKLHINVAEQLGMQRLEFVDPVPVKFATPDAFKVWETWALGIINNTSMNDRTKSLWSRATEKAMRIATLLALFDDPQFPAVTVEHVRWAIEWQTHVCSETSRQVSEKAGQSRTAELEVEIMRQLEKGHKSYAKLCQRSALLRNASFDQFLAAARAIEAKGIAQIRSGKNYSKLSFI